MNCDRARELASEALDGVLATDDDAAYTRHLDDCPPCRSFHAELKESLQLLGELPAIEVSRDFDDEVWRRIRRAQAPAGAWNALWERAAAWAERFHGMAPAWRWSPVGVAAAVLCFFAISNPPGLPVASRSAGNEATRATTIAPSAGAERFAEALPNRSTSARARSASTDAEPAADSVGEIPTAIERFLQIQDDAGSGRDLNLEGDRESYRRSNYSYPLRRIPDPTYVAGTGALPVDSGPIGVVPFRGERPAGPSPAWPGAGSEAPRASSGGNAVIAF